MLIILARFEEMKMGTQENVGLWENFLQFAAIVTYLFNRPSIGFCHTANKVSK